MKVKNYQIQNLSRSLRENAQAKYAASTALTLANISRTIEPFVMELEKQLVALSKNYRVKTESGGFTLDQEGYKTEAEPMVLLEVEVAIPDRVEIDYKKDTSFTTDFFRNILDIYGDNVVFKEV